MTSKTSLILLCILANILNISCSSHQQIKREVANVSKRWITSFNNGDIASITSAYAENAVMTAKPFGTFNGQEAIHDFWAPFLKSGATDLKYFNTNIEVIDADTVQLSSDWSMNVGEGIITNETWVKQNGFWKLIKDEFEVKKQFKKENMNTKKETFVLVHSAWLGAWQWENVASALRKEGHTVITPDLPGHGNDKTSPAKITMDDYVNTLTTILDQQQEPVILVGHSFNGITISRAAELRTNKVKRLVYLSAFLLPNGGSFFNAVQQVSRSKAVENFYLSEDKTYALVKENEIQNAFAHDIPKASFDQAKPYIVPEPAAPLQYELEISEKNFGSIPKDYIECTEDKAIPIAVQRAMYTGNVQHVYTLNSSHTPNFSQPGKLADILLKVIEQ